MDNLLKKTRLAVEKYHSKQAGDKLKATRTILSAVVACRNFITETEGEDGGEIQKLTRELREVLSGLPMFRNITAEENIDTKQMADEQLDMIQQDLEKALKEMQEGKKKKVQEWVKAHPVLGKLKKSTAKELPQGAYVLLFRRSASLPPRRKGSKQIPPATHDNAVASMTIMEPASVEHSPAQSAELQSHGQEPAAVADQIVLIADQGTTPEREPEKSSPAEEKVSMAAAAENVEFSSDVAPDQLSPSIEGAISPVKFMREEPLFVDLQSGSDPVVLSIQADIQVPTAGVVAAPVQGSLVSEQEAADQGRNFAVPEQSAVGPEGIVALATDQEPFSSAQDQQILSVPEQNAAVQEQDTVEQNAAAQEQKAAAPELSIAFQDSAATCVTEGEGNPGSAEPNVDSDKKEAQPQRRARRYENGQPPVKEKKPKGRGGAPSQPQLSPPLEKAVEADAAIVAAKPVVEKVPPDLVVRPTPDGKVFTRFRPKEFSDDVRLYRMFRGGPPLVGACIIADGKLVASIGVLPEPDEGHDQLRLLLSISRDAVGKPGRDFVESNPVLSELYQISKSRSIHKDAYILLFQLVEEKSDEKPEEKSREKSVEQPEEKTEPSAEKESTETEDQGSSPAEELHEAENDEPSSEISAEDENSGTPGTVDEESNTPDDTSSVAEEAPQKTPTASRLELVSKTTEDGRIITRYRSFDFSDMRALYETYKKRPPIVGAAIIRERELIKIIGTVPSAEGSKQLDVLLGASRQALEKPSVDYITAHPVLSGLYELANGEYRQKEYGVVLFTENEGRLEILSLPDKRGKLLARTPLSEFRIPKILHERFKSERQLVGASIISEQAPSAPVRDNRPSGKDKDRDRDKGDRDRGGKGDGFRSRNAPPRNQIVLAAIGRTPLKQNVLLSVEILKRLGVDLSILESEAPPPRRW